MCDPLISVIIPTFSSAACIETCIESIVNQTFKNFEILIMDNFSTDKTVAIAKSFNDDRIRIYSEPDNGIYDAMNKGIKLSLGEWVYFLGSDDELFDSSVVKKVSSLLLNTFSKLVYGNVCIEGNAGWAIDQQIYDGEFNLSKILDRNICHQSIFYKRILFENSVYNEDFKVCGDYDFNLRLFSKYQFQFIDLIIARFNGGGTSALEEDENFNLSTCVIHYFYPLLYKSEFSRFKNAIRAKAISSSKLLEKIYLNAVYLKHKLFTHAKQD